MGLACIGVEGVSERHGAVPAGIGVADADGGGVPLDVSLADGDGLFDDMHGEILVGSQPLLDDVHVAIDPKQDDALADEEVADGDFGSVHAGLSLVVLHYYNTVTIVLQ